MTRVATIVCLALFAASCAAQQTAHLPSAPPPGEPGALVGLGAAQLKIAFGSPSFMRHDGDVQMWRYDGAHCRAFFFLYPEQTGLAVRHVETLPRPSDAAADPACLNALRGVSAPVS